MALTLTLWVSVEERDAAGAIREVEEATEIHAEFDRNTVDGLKRALAKELQPLRSRSIGTIKLYFKPEHTSLQTEWTKLEPDWPVLPGATDIKRIPAQYAGGLPNNACVVVVLPAPTAPATVPPVPGECYHILASTKYSASCTYRTVPKLFLFSPLLFVIPYLSTLTSPHLPTAFVSLCLPAFVQVHGMRLSCMVTVSSSHGRPSSSPGTSARQRLTRILLRQLADPNARGAKSLL
jgi:hypothetical protein